MKYRRLGKTGMKVSEVALGSWITLGYKVDREETARIVQDAFERGINFFDTADVYSGGEAERVLGAALSEIPRKDFVLASKCFFPSGDGPNDRGLSRKHIVESCEASLGRLGTDYLDLYQCHRFDPDSPTEETLWALDHLVRQGKILYYGVSEWTASQISDACEITRRDRLHPIASNQPMYNLLDRKIEPDILPVCGREGIGNIVFSPLAQGVLTGKYSGGTIPKQSRGADQNTATFVKRYLDQASLAAADRVVNLAKECGVTPAQLSLAWCLRRPEVTSVIIGVTSLKQLENNIRATSVEMPPDVSQALENLLSSNGP